VSRNKSENNLPLPLESWEGFLYGDFVAVGAGEGIMKLSKRNKKKKKEEEQH